MSEVSIKFLMPVKVAFTGEKGPREDIGKALGQINQFLKEKKIKVAGSAMSLLYEDPRGIDLRKAHFEVCMPISGKVKGEGQIKEKELEKGAFASIAHTGSLDKLPEVYQIILKWIEENQYQIAGPAREIYHKGIGESGGGEFVVEVQFPVRK